MPEAVDELVQRLGSLVQRYHRPEYGNPKLIPPTDLNGCGVAVGIMFEDATLSSHSYILTYHSGTSAWHHGETFIGNPLRTFDNALKGIPLLREEQIRTRHEEVTAAVYEFSPAEHYAHYSREELHLLGFE